jgi:hypothetical protein
MAQHDNDLRRQMDKAVERKVKFPMALAMKRMTLEAFSRVVQRSPVDTGRFRANWQVGVGTRPTTYSTELADRASQGAPPNGDGMSMTLEQVAKINPQTVATYVVNNLPYAERLENGHSQQAPNGMVEVTAQELRVAAKEIVAQALAGAK